MLLMLFEKADLKERGGAGLRNELLEKPTAPLTIGVVREGQGFLWFLLGKVRWGSSV